MELKHKNITEIIIKAYFEVYNELGFGFLESIYESALSIALSDKGLGVERQKDVSVYFRGQLIGVFRPDLIIEDKVIIEFKAVKHLLPEHEAQILNYLKSTDIEVGMLINFGQTTKFKRFVFENSRKAIREDQRQSAATYLWN